MCTGLFVRLVFDGLKRRIYKILSAVKIDCYVGLSLATINVAKRSRQFDQLSHFQTKMIIFIQTDLTRRGWRLMCSYKGVYKKLTSLLKLVKELEHFWPLQLKFSMSG